MTTNHSPSAAACRAAAAPDPRPAVPAAETAAPVRGYHGGSRALSPSAAAHDPAAVHAVPLLEPAEGGSGTVAAPRGEL